MLLKQKKSLRILAVIMVLSLVQMSLGTVWAAPQQIVAKVLTMGGSIKVNNADTPTGSSIVSGAVVETPDNVAATIQIGSLGVVELPPGTSAIIEFAGNNIKVTLKRGCAVLQTNKGTTGSVVDTNGKFLSTNGEGEIGVSGETGYRREVMTAKSDGRTSGRFPVCGIIPPGAAVVTAPAAVIPGVIAAGGAGAGLGGGAIAAIVAGIVGGGVITGIIVGRGDNPSPGAP